ncbi:hypothetical protein [Mucilaginibacter sp.]|uniref:hypothetical protein n=1 Tax=Mucilaginibacter sp. TaxID=1882438 RepID=UPI0035629100
MKYIYSIIKADYLQRTRSYAFLITLAITIFAAYSFVPLPTASYTTLNMPGYKGIYNSAWVGYVSAIMTTVMLSLYGFFLVNGGIKKDIDTGVGFIVATTSITNFGYLLSKMLSNFLVLLTIMGVTFVVSIVMFFVRTTGYPFHIADFALPYLLFALPALLTISSLAVVFEVFLGNKTVLQYITFVFLFGAITANVNTQPNNTVAVLMDPYGLRTMTNSIKNKVNTQYHTHIKEVSFGFIFNHKQSFKTFEWNGITFTRVFLLSRILWLGIALALAYLSSFFFHRFDLKQSVRKKKKDKVVFDIQAHTPAFAPQGISRSLLPPIITDYSILPFIKTELLLLMRKGSKWVWLVIAGLWIGTIFAPLNIAHTYMLPVLLFLQVTRWSEIATKEKTNRLHYFTYSSYKPLLRMLPAQILAGVLLAFALALPVIARYAFALDIYAIINIINGCVLIVLLAVCLGIISGGKKLYEIIFFLLTYAITQKVPVADYLGTIKPSNSINYIAVILIFNILLTLVSFTVRNYQTRHL